MSATAEKRSVPPPVPPHGLHSSRGFVIDASRRSSTLLPPPNPLGQADGRVAPLSELLEQVTDDSNGEEIDSDVAQAPELKDTLVPNRAIVETAALLSADAPLSSTIRPVAAQERAELDIQDYSLRLDNPYAPSSLVPPKSRKWGRTALLVVTGAVAGAVASLAGSTMLPSTPPPSRNSEHPTSIAIAHEAPVSVAPEPQPTSVQPAAWPPVMQAGPPAPVPPVPVPPVKAPEGAQTSVGVAMVSVGPSKVQAPATRMESRGVKLVKPRAPRRPRRAGMGRKMAVVHAPATVSASHDAPTVALPRTPTREQIVAGFAQIRDELARCAGGKSGVVQIGATILSSGRISTAVIGGDFKGTAEGTCMAQAARLANFGRFSQATLKVGFPMAL